MIYAPNMWIDNGPERPYEARCVPIRVNGDVQRIVGVNPDHGLVCFLEAKEEARHQDRGDPAREDTNHQRSDQNGYHAEGSRAAEYYDIQ